MSTTKPQPSQPARGRTLPLAGVLVAVLVASLAGNVAQHLRHRQVLATCAARAAQRSEEKHLHADNVTGDAGLSADVLSTPAQLPERRVSGLGPRLSNAELHGGWQLSQAVFDRALHAPNATLISPASPRVVLVRHFLSSEEVEHLIGLAGDEFARSEVVADGEKQQDVRTSYGAWLTGEKRDDVVLGIQHRIHDLVGIPEEFGESLYVLRYADGQRYDAHPDNCALERGKPDSDACRSFLARAGGPGCGPGAGGVTCGDRLATVILYLRSPSRGGATAFPSAQPTVASTAAAPRGSASDDEEEVEEEEDEEEGSIAEYCRPDADTLQVLPEAGSAVIFWSYVPSGDPAVAVPDAASLHGGCPVLEGTKLIATRWIRASEFH
eukprot:scaffold3.g6413.t1